MILKNKKYCDFLIEETNKIKTNVYVCSFKSL